LEKSVPIGWPSRAISPSASAIQATAAISDTLMSMTSMTV
jgi:hypothetical protein